MIAAHLSLPEHHLSALAAEHPFTGIDEARASGINIKRTRMLFIVASTLVTASAVSMCGQVGWIGLLIPHASRMLVGSNNRYVVPLSLSLGASFMISSRSISIIRLPLSILTTLSSAL